jgi:hypothetical protein
MAGNWLIRGPSGGVGAWGRFQVAVCARWRSKTLHVRTTTREQLKKSQHIPSPLSCLSSVILGRNPPRKMAMATNYWNLGKTNQTERVICAFEHVF